MSKRSDRRRAALESANTASSSPTLRRFAPWLALIGAAFIYLGFSAWRITDLFATVSADTNGDSGMAVWNWLRHGPASLKFGLFSNWLSGDPGSASGLFYAHHPIGFLFPVYLSFLLFGVHEWSVRLGPLFCMTISLPFLFIALRRIFSDRIRPAFMVLIAYVLLPGTIYYGKTFELSVFSLPAALITWSLFVLYRNNPTNRKLIWLLVSVFIGGTMGWFYYFLPGAIWLIIAIFPKILPVKKRLLLLVALPLILITTFCLHLSHAYILNGASSFSDISGIFAHRISRDAVSLGSWFSQIWQISAANFTLFFLVLGLVGLTILLKRIWQDHQSAPRDLLPLILFPVLNTIVFFEWSTHPFGLIFFLPAIAIGTGYLLEYLFARSPQTGLTACILALVIGSIFTIITLKDWHASLVLGRADIRSLQELRPQIEKWDLCLGENQEGISYAGILAWYLRRPIRTAPSCLNDLEPKAVAILFNPDFYQSNQKFYAEKIREFEALDFKKFRCVTGLCFYTRESKQP